MREKILIIDDDKDFTSLLKYRLEQHDYEVAFAHNGREGVEKARDEQPNLIILDVMLPEMDGYNVSRILKFDIKYRNIPIILFTARPYVILEDIRSIARKTTAA